jgi:hypothetical protein
MAFTEEQYARIRPFLYHLTARSNFERLAQSRLLQSAASLLNEAGRLDLTSFHRKSAMTVNIDRDRVIIRDQLPLHIGNIEFVEGWTFHQLVGHLNRHVFFWSGWEAKAIEHCIRHFEHYAGERPVIFRAPFVSVVKANLPRHPLFCKYNSGSPRMVGGQRSPRGAGTFARAQACAFSAGEVVEVVYRDAVVLPANIEWAQKPSGPWIRLTDSPLP